ncbi:hypothetical protein Ddye_019571 [Dipteronia dyeriana]|uniref:Uncharacterized protein n=1 Tax=Dipteronia dyeriana TaxID=168575 RepID=A0AAD9TYG1_9ROSI|nr:hypothetical protein Ddye_019571 [Dipteronia dyeriana]
MTLSANTTTTTTTTATKPQKPAGEIEEIAVFSRFDVVSDYSDHYYVVSNLPKKSSAAAVSGGDPFASASMVSDKFKGLMLQLYPDLVAAFSRAEASLGNLPRQLNVETVTASFKGPVLVKNNNNNKNKEINGKSGIAKKVLGKMKVVLGLKKRVHQSKVKN